MTVVDIDTAAGVRSGWLITSRDSHAAILAIMADGTFALSAPRTEVAGRS